MAFATVLLGAAIWVGAKARDATAALTARRQAWASAANQVATVRQQFQAPTAQESAAIISESSRSGVLGVPSSEKLTLVDAVGRLAEACGLTNVRATPVKTIDSLFVPPRQIGTRTLPAEDYQVTLSATGSFAGVVQLVSTLPPSVTVSRLVGARQGQGTTYELLLSVYRLDADQAK
jgi:hypothetical protein